MKLHKRAQLNIFSKVTTAIALLVILIMGSAIGAILIKGIPELPRVINSAEIHFALCLSFITSCVSTVIIMLLALPASYALTRTPFPMKGVANIVIELTLSLPYILLGLSLLIIFSSDFGKALKEVGIKVVFSQLGIVMAQILVNLPYAIRLLRTAMESIDPRMEFIAKTLGASDFKAFTTVLIPSCRNSIISTCILTWSRALGEFGATLMLVGITRMKTETLPGSIYLSISTGNNDTAMATAVVMFVIAGATLCIANILQQKSLTKRRTQ